MTEPGEDLVFLGNIELPESFDENRWDRLLSDHPEFKATDSIRLINPYTEKISVITSARKLAHVMESGVVVGNLRWCIDDSGIEVSGVPDAMEAYARNLAEELGTTWVR